MQEYISQYNIIYPQSGIQQYKKLPRLEYQEANSQETTTKR